MPKISKKIKSNKNIKADNIGVNTFENFDEYISKLSSSTKKINIKDTYFFLDNKLLKKDEIINKIEKSGLKIIGLKKNTTLSNTIEEHINASSSKNKSKSKNSRVGDSTKQYFTNIVNSANVLTLDDEKKYISLLNSKKELDRKLAKNELVSHNQRLIVSIAQRYAKNASNIDLQDLIQEGQLGLFRAIDKFDPNTEFKFSTYATWWIQQAITKYISEQKNLMIIPTHMANYINICNKNEEILFNKLGRKPSVRELSDYLIKYEQKENPKSAKLDFSIEKIMQIKKLSSKPVSIDKSINYDSDSEVSDFISDENNILDDYEKQDLKKRIRNILHSNLNGKELAIICGIFGLDYFTFDNNIKFDSPKKKSELAKIFNISEVDVTKFFNTAKNKLRKIPEFASLVDNDEENDENED